MTRGAVAAALAATVALGASAPAAVAGPKADHAKATHKTVKATKADKAKAAKVDRTLTPAERRTLRQAKRKQAYLDRLLGSNKLDRLGGTAEDAVRKNIEDDITELAAFITPAAPVESETSADSVDVRSYRPEVYHTIINQLRLATRLQAAGDALPEGTVTEVPAVNALGTLVGDLMTFDADTTRAELRAAQRTLSAAQAAIEDADESEDESDDEIVTGAEADTPADGS
jgi:hypothetical protein